MRSSRSFIPWWLVPALLVALSAQICIAGDYQLKRKVTPKPTYAAIPETVNASLIVFKLSEAVDRPEVADGVFLGSGGYWGQLNEILSAGDRIESIDHRIKIDRSSLDRMRHEGSRRIGWQLPDMSLYYEARLKNGLSETEKLELINELNSLDLVEIAYFAYGAELPSHSDPQPSETPSWQYMQYYLLPAPIGLDAYYGWSFSGGRGENVRVIDIESDWNETHEDLHGGVDTFHLAGTRTDVEDSRSHGTSVLGIIAADSNSFGVTGISYNVDLGTVAAEYEWPYLANAILTASNNASVGDIILVEMAAIDDGGTGQVAIEYVQENFDAILTASALGQIVVEPVGNSDNDFDDTALYDSLFYPEYRFSGAIMVGASYADHTPAPFTNYGSRVDVHGFGCWDIYTLGWGYLYGTEPDNYYTGWFSGTSAAGPVVTGACAVLQGISKANNGVTLDHNQMRDLLTTYSTPQKDHYKHVGPMPNLAGSCDAVTGFTRPAAPAPMFPEDDAYFDAPAQLTLDWEDVSGAESYDVMIDDDNDFSTPLGQQQGLSVSQWMTPELEPGMYFWRVRGNNTGAFGSWSTARTIVIGIDVQAPVHYYPVDGKTASNTYNFTFQWQRIEGVNEYVVEVGTDEASIQGSFPKQAYTQSCDEELCQATFFLYWPVEYFWRVKVVDEEWPWSDYSYFKMIGYPKDRTTKGSSKKAGVSAASDKAVLSGNRPNPFNPTTEINFSLPHACQVTLEIFNIAGQKVSTLVNGYQIAGEHTVVWNAGGAASGVYLYRLQAGDHIESRKMLLVK